uniref:TRAP transporter permease n=1 Tax=candidate division WOR-3 bacterium TaxID=2052148 RepID=A0A7C2K2H0_UNCW3
MRKVIKGIGVGLCMFHLYTALFGSLEALQQRSLHLWFVLVIAFLTKPFFKKGKYTLWFDVCWILSVCACILYIFVQHEWIVSERFALITPLTFLEKILAIIAIAAVLEATRRIVGWSLFIVTLVFLVYPFVGPLLKGILYSHPVKIEELLDFQYLGTAGIFGIPLGVSATEIAVFIIFGSVMLQTGISELINNVAYSIAGRSSGGPAKIAVVASSLFGTISGSGTANVVTTGTFTIPMMKKIGYKPHFAGAIEAVASTGGQIMPPIMGAAAFVMSAFSGIPYSNIIVYGIVPAILYYTGLYATVHLEALRAKIPPSEVKPNIWKTLRDYAHMVIPIIVLLYLLFSGFSVRFAGGMGVITAIIVAQMRSTTRLNLWKILEALENGAKNLAMVGVACASASMIVGVVDFTGLGQRIGAGFMELTGGNLWLGLLLGMLLAILLGTGMPTTAAYVIQAATVVPSLIKMGLLPIVAHMFCFYFSCLSLITPPVAITAYAASAIAGSSIWKTGWTAFKIGLGAYLVPFAFAYNPSLLLIGSVWEIFHTIVTAFLGIMCLVIGIEGFLWIPLKFWERLIAVGAAIFLITPSLTTILPGVLLMMIIFVIQFKKKKSNF